VGKQVDFQGEGGGEVQKIKSIEAGGPVGGGGGGGWLLYEGRGNQILRVYNLGKVRNHC